MSGLGEVVLSGGDQEKQILVIFREKIPFLVQVTQPLNKKT